MGTTRPAKIKFWGGLQAGFHPAVAHRLLLRAFHHSDRVTRDWPVVLRVRAPTD